MGPVLDALGTVFEVLRPLGQGATAQVELVRLCEPVGGLAAGSELALKRPVGRDAETLARARQAFAAEAQASQRVRDPSLVRIRHQGEDALGPYLLSDFVPGRSLREILAEEGVLPEPLVRRAGEQLAGALAALHAAGLVHGDVKPENARLDEEGRAVLLDLGFARCLAAEEPREHAGSLAYLSPERARGGGATRASDVFALGLLLYEVVTGVHPFGYADPRAPTRASALFGLGVSTGEILRRSIEVPGADQLLAAIATGRTRPASHFAPDLSPFLDQLLADLLQRAAARRPSAAEAALRLREGEAGAWWRARVDPDDARERRGARVEQHLTPLVGREAELAELARALEAVRASPRKEGHSEAVWLAGPEGSGKWRLVDEFAQRSRRSDRPPLYLYARCNDRYEARPGGALLLLLHRWLQLPPGAPPGEREAERLRELVVPGAARTLLRALGSEVAEGVDHSPAAALAECLSALGRRMPLIVFVDDLHRAGTETLVSLNALVDALSETRALLILGTRDDREPLDARRLTWLEQQLEARAGHGAGVGFRRLLLGPLSEAHVAELIDSLFEKEAPRRALAHALWLRSRGNPGLLTELLRELAQRGAIQSVDGPGGAGGEDARLRLTVDPEDLPLSSSLGRIIAERFQSLEPGERLWLERMSVAGGRIEAEYLMRAFPPTGRAEIDALLARLVRKGWLVPVATRYRFERPALREVVYRSIPAKRRRRLHRAAAQSLLGNDSNESRYQRAFHLRAAQLYESLCAEVLELIGRLRGHASATRILTVARWGLEALETLAATPERNRQRLFLLETAADASDRLGLRDEERAFLDHLAEMELSPDEFPSEGARTYLLHGRYAAGTGQFGLARGMLRSAVELAERSGDARLTSEALRRMALVQAQIGDLPDAERLARRAVLLASGGEERALALLALVIPALLEDRVEDALGSIDEAIAILRGQEHAGRGVVAHAQMLRARTWRSAGQPLRALGACGRSVRLAQQSGERRLEAEARARYGQLLIDADRVAQAEGELREALYVADRIEDRRGAVLAELFLGILLWENADAGAFDAIRRSSRRARELGFARAEAVASAVESRVHRERGSLADADEASARAMELLERHGAELSDRVAIQGTRVLVLESMGRKAPSRALLRALRAEIRRRNARLRDPELRARQMDYVQRLLEAVRSPEGVIYPRTPG